VFTFTEAVFDGSPGQLDNVSNWTISIRQQNHVSRAVIAREVMLPTLAGKPPVAPKRTRPTCAVCRQTLVMGHQAGL
jgi:hypothetical protein